MRKITLVLCIFLCARWFSYCAAQQEQELVGWLKFDEGKGETAKDSSGNKNHGEVYAEWTSGKAGSALNFDGESSYVDCGDGASLNLTSAGSIEVWIKSKKAYPGEDAAVRYRGIVSKTSGGGAAGLSYWLDWMGNSETRTLRAIICDGSKAEWWNCTQGFFINDFDFGKDWNHIVFTWDGKTMNLYRNGVPYPAVAQTMKAQALPEAPLMIGSAFGGRQNCFDGIIDEVKIYDRALTAREVMASYKNKN